MTVHPLMLCIHMEKERALRFSFAAMSLGVRVRMVEDSQLGQTLGAACGLDAPPAHGPGGGVAEEMLLLAFLPEDTLDALLRALRATGLPPVRLKAVLTPVNRGWDFARLYRELAGEAAAFAAGGGARED